MNSHFRIRILDGDSVLTELDKFQIERMIWLRLAPHKEFIHSVEFQISQMDHHDYEIQHTARMEVKLKSGREICHVLSRISKAAVAMSAIDDMKQFVDSRIQFETGWIYRMQKLVSQTLGALLGTNERYGDRIDRMTSGLRRRNKSMMRGTPSPIE
ncbi:MAG: hypothetical protein AAF623_04870 [Planctomycetota bacterium]